MIVHQKPTDQRLSNNEEYEIHVKFEVILPGRIFSLREQSPLFRIHCEGHDSRTDIRIRLLVLLFSSEIRFIVRFMKYYSIEDRSQIGRNKNREHISCSSLEIVDSSEGNELNLGTNLIREKIISKS